MKRLEGKAKGDEQMPYAIRSRIRITTCPSYGTFCTNQSIPDGEAHPGLEILDHLASRST